MVYTFKDEYASVKSKAEALRNITERYDGYGNSIKRVMEQKQNNIYFLFRFVSFF